MKIKSFYRNQKEVAQAINDIINNYWDNKLPEDNMINMIKNILENNESLIFKNNDYATLLKQKCGKRRLKIISKIIENN